VILITVASGCTSGFLSPAGTQNDCHAVRRSEIRGRFRWSGPCQVSRSLGSVFGSKIQRWYEQV